MIELSPENYVLKPQEEGGGHNYFDQNILNHLNRLNGSER